tara:strand:- start:825 stop:995 length:171 start_codon:yes stop_codon:yes gene_type:complete
MDSSCNPTDYTELIYDLGGNVIFYTDISLNEERRPKKKVKFCLPLAVVHRLGDGWE